MTLKPKAVVTGGAGFIGSHLVEALLPDYQVVVFDDFSTGHRNNLFEHDHVGEKTTIVRGDIRDPISVFNVLRDADLVFHLAARTSVPRSVEDPGMTHDVNVNGTLNLLVQSVRRHVKRFVLASSSSVYGNNGKKPKDESLRTNPLSPYAASKVSAENYCLAYNRSYRLGVVILRYFNVYGPRQLPGAYSAAIPNFLNQIIKERPLTVFGDGSQTRDFTFVSDVVQGTLLASQVAEADGQIFNIATGKAVSINRIVQLVARIGGSPTREIEFERPRTEDVKHSRANIARAKEVLGYEPRVNIVEGLQNMYEWMTNRTNPIKNKLILKHTTTKNNKHFPRKYKSRHFLVEVILFGLYLLGDYLQDGVIDGSLLRTLLPAII